MTTGRLDPTMSALLRGGLAVALAAAACGGDPATEPPAEGAGPLEAAGRPVAQKRPATPGEWFTVDESEERRLEGRSVYHQGLQRPPALLDRRPVILPLPPDEIPTDPLLVQAVVSDTGRVVRVHVLRWPALPGVVREVMARRLVAALRAFRFRPARLDGRPVAVYYNLSLTTSRWQWRASRASRSLGGSPPGSASPADEMCCRSGDLG